ncbi:MAG: sigma-54-dependent Fis family transcriptional regulator [Planctomycetes bacterium]|nr:sigma-54-dependent Fis family transcriptional regulator [Planctomycetota bacterium]
MEKERSVTDGERAKTPTIVMVVDDDADICVALEMILRYEGFEVWTAPNGKQALARLEKEQALGRRPELILTDVKMPELDGLALLEKVRERPDPPAVVMISGHGDVATAVDAVRRGAQDFLEKPLDQNRVLVALQNALRQTKLARENRVLRRQLSGRWELRGKSEPMRRLKAELARVAASDAPVLITGENGTGKEVVARALHFASAVSAGPFVPVNCAAIPSELIESELFGHEKGSFTGAHERRIGHFEAASGGTLFLDEIGDMPLAAQAKVLRALETREVTRVGGSKPFVVEIRVVAATNADLNQAVKDKTFRMDLFYRLNVVPLRVPPLRERLDDVPLLCEHFLAEVAARTGRRPRELEPEALALLRGLAYPGNVRQLRNLLEAASVLAEGTITRADLERILENGPGLSTLQGGVAARADDPFTASTFEEFKERSEALFFRLKLAENEGNVKRTAERLDMQRSHLYKKLERFNLK